MFLTVSPLPPIPQLAPFSPRAFPSISLNILDTLPLSPMFRQQLVRRKRQIQKAWCTCFPFVFLIPLPSISY